MSQDRLDRSFHGILVNSGIVHSTALRPADASSQIKRALPELLYRQGSLQRTVRNGHRTGGLCGDDGTVIRDHEPHVAEAHDDERKVTSCAQDGCAERSRPRGAPG